MQAAPDYSKHFYSGLSGLQLPLPKYAFPPPYENVSRLTYYASIFNSIEINSTFYKIPRSATVSKWAASVPAQFRFTFKLWKEITHGKGFNFKKEDVVAFFDAVNSVEEKKGCLLIQFPPSLGKEYRVQLENLLRCIRESDPTHQWKAAVEFRNSSWYHGDIYELLDSFQSTMVIHDIPTSATPLIDQKSDFLYYRFHGPTGNYRDSYSKDFLREYAALIREGIAEEKTVYGYFNNTMGDAFHNLKTLNAFIENQ